jgi:hypothetical protein
VPGDFDGDGIVDPADYDAWRSAFGNLVFPVGSGADGNRDGVVDAADYVIWRKNFGGVLGPASSASAVPEPSGWSSLFCAICSALAPCLRRKSASCSRRLLKTQ